MTVIVEMREAAAALPDSPVKKMLIWAELELGERADRIFELEADVEELYREIDKYRLALHSVIEKADGILKDVRASLFDMPAPAVDLAPYKNVMAAHGVEPYAKTKRSKKEKA